MNTVDLDSKHDATSQSLSRSLRSVFQNKQFTPSVDNISFDRTCTGVLRFDGTSISSGWRQRHKSHQHSTMPNVDNAINDNQRPMTDNISQIFTNKKRIFLRVIVKSFLATLLVE